MTPRKQRLSVVLDTNVLVRAFKTSSNTNWNRRILRLWLIEGKLQLIVSPELLDEYLGVFENVLGMEPDLVKEWQVRFESDGRSSIVNLGRRYTASRDPDDNIVLATAFSGIAKYLITNDRDLLDLPDEFQRTLKFQIITPSEFVRSWDESE
jgi:putative PIN family toxin of toxin-antitoxin system